MSSFHQWRLERLPLHPGLPVAYIAGPMTGLPDFNRQAFEDAADLLRGLDVKVVSPVELDEEEGFDPGAYEGEQWAVNDGTYRKFLLRDIKAIIEHNVDCIFVLEGWENSKGAALEVHVARSVGLPIFTLSGEQVKAPTKYRPPSDENVAETAQRLVGGDRQEQYGHPIEDFARTAGVINSLYGTEFGPRDIPIIMMAVKLSRIIQSPSKRDSIVDLIGYGLTYEMVAEREGDPLS